jgi:hypothetical protein
LGCVIAFSPNAQLTDGGTPLTPELPSGDAGPPLDVMLG